MSEASAIVLYACWTLWTGWLGPDRIDTWGVSVPGMLVAGWMDGNETHQAMLGETPGLLALLYRPIPRSLERPAVGSDDPEVATGLRLPRELDPRVSSKYEEEFETLLTGDFVIRNFVELRWARRFRFIAPTLWDRDSQEYVAWLAARQDILPPRRVDTLIYYYTETDAGHFQDEAFWRATTPTWRRMATAKNPYYRLRSIVFARHWARDWQEERTVYLNALKERDEWFVSYALQAIAQRGSLDPELQEAIEHVLRAHPPEKGGTIYSSVGVAAETALKALRERGAVATPRI